MDEIWNVIYTASRHEKKVATQFVQKGIIHYLPILKVKSKWSDRIKTVEKPLFNGYVFVKQVAHYDHILQTKGVVGFLKYNGQNAKVYQHEIDTIKSMIQYGYDMKAESSKLHLEVGQKVILIDGPLKGLYGYYNSYLNEDWFIIKLEQMGTTVNLKVPQQIIQPVNE